MTDAETDPGMSDAPAFEVGTSPGSEAPACGTSSLSDSEAGAADGIAREAGMEMTASDDNGSDDGTVTTTAEDSPNLLSPTGNSSWHVGGSPLSEH
jgi:hypothetical protein